MKGCTRSRLCGISGVGGLNLCEPRGVMRQDVVSQLLCRGVNLTLCAASDLVEKAKNMPNKAPHSPSPTQLCVRQFAQHVDFSANTPVFRLLTHGLANCHALRHAAYGSSWIRNLP